MITFNKLIKYSRKKKKKKLNNRYLNKNPQKKGICQKIYTISPKKPNSAMRKVAKVKILSTNKIIIAYIPGENHSLQEYNFVLIRGGKTKDLPGVNYKIIRGALDSLGVIKRKNSRSKYGTKKI